ncbi:MCE family protein [Mycolicibacterium setense]
MGIAATAILVTVALAYQNIPLFQSGDTYTAYFTEAGGLAPGAPVQVAGFQVGDVTDVSLDGAQVLVTFTVDRSVELGDRTEAAIKTMTLLGNRMLDIAPRGDSSLTGPIPVQRTRPPYELPQALGDLSQTIETLNTNQLNDALTTLAETFKDTPADLRLAVQGITRFSETLNKRDDQLRQLLANANNVVGVLRERTDRIVELVNASNDLLGQLRGQNTSLRYLATNISSLAQQVSGLIHDNGATLRPSLEKLNGVLTMIDNRRDELTKAINLASKFSLSLGESVSGGPFFKEYLANVVPGQFLQPFIDAAFSDLGLDPNTLLPSQLSDPQVGQPATPPLPMPYPRTGQGGLPATTLPDAITGNLGDPRYPYKPPLDQPPPGGPPPGPPAGYDPASPNPAAPTPTETEVGTPNLVPPLPAGMP